MIRRLTWLGAVLTTALALLLAGCGSGGTGESAGTASAPAPPAAQSVSDKDFGRVAFHDPTSIDNQWMPLVPGTQLSYLGYINEEDGRVEHRVVTTVTDLTKTIDGVPTVVVLDRDYNDDQLVEAELAFQAQDDTGTVWSLGEYPEEWEEGKFTGAPDTWIAGVAGARPGILMRAEPRVGTPQYLQGWAPAIHFDDTARVLRTGQRTCVPVRCYDNVLVTDEWNPSEPGAHQRKFYAPQVGNVRADFAGAQEKEKETLSLVKVAHLDRHGLAVIHQQALALDKHAYTAARKVYQRTPPAR
jgi:F0F1-type ATP synthase membrane subunit c/vacuolar-type H+-ATPase subunit K